jgi:hypothetical protein
MAEEDGQGHESSEDDWDEEDEFDDEDDDGDEDDDEDEDEDEDDEHTVLNVAELRAGTSRGATRIVTIERKIVQDLGEVLAAMAADNVPLDFQDCVIFKAKIKSTEATFFFDGCVFKERLDCKDGTFDGELSFEDSTFEKEADFSGAVFKADLDFEDCVFHETVSFSKTIFAKKARLRSCEFAQEVIFDNASFQGEADLSDATSGQATRYTDAQVGNAVALSHCVFEKGQEITGSNLRDTKTDSFTSEVNSEEKSSQGNIERTTTPRHQRVAKEEPKKGCTRRELLQGVLRFMPQDKEE